MLDRVLLILPTPGYLLILMIDGSSSFLYKIKLHTKQDQPNFNKTIKRIFLSIVYVSLCLGGIKSLSERLFIKSIMLTNFRSS